MKNCIPLLFVLLLLSGCGNNVKLRGKVTFADDTPLTVGTVCFQNGAFLARGFLQPDGSYVVGSLTEVDGLPPGSYRVYIAGAQRVIGEDKDELPIYESLIDEKYARPETSGLTLKVESSQRRFDIRVDKKS